MVYIYIYIISPRQEAEQLMYWRGLFLIGTKIPLDKPLSYLSHPRLQAMGRK